MPENIELLLRLHSLVEQESRPPDRGARLQNAVSQREHRLTSIIRSGQLTIPQIYSLPGNPKGNNQCTVHELVVKPRVLVDRVPYKCDFLFG